MDYNKHITDLSDSDFLSFLYAERERENNIHGFHGWNNWALIGAIITFVCSGYTILVNNPELRKLNVLYYTISLMSLFFAYHYLETIFSKVRKVDYSKVRMMKEVFPLERIVFIFFFGITSSVLIALFDRCNSIFFLWILIIVAYVIVCIVCKFNKEKIVPSYNTEMTLPWNRANILYTPLICGAFGWMMSESFNIAGGKILSKEFEFASCIAAVLILIYFLLKLNFGNIVVMRFDVIIDKYLYIGSTKEETFHEISKNRMGYGVIDACYKELQSVEKKTNLCVEEEKELGEIKKFALSENCDLNRVQEYQNRLDVILDNQRSALALTKKLTDRVDEIVKVSSVYKDITEIKYVFDTNKKCYGKVNEISTILDEVSKILHIKEMKILEEDNVTLKNILKKKEKELRNLKDAVKNK